MLTVTFKQNEAKFLKAEFDIETDSNHSYTFSNEQAADIQDICLDIDNEEHAVENGNIKRGRVAEDTYYTMLAAWPKGSDWVKYLKKQ